MSFIKSTIRRAINCRKNEDDDEDDVDDGMRLFVARFCAVCAYSYRFALFFVVCE